MSFLRLAQLWLHEPDAPAARQAFVLLGVGPCDPAELAPGYADLFLLNVQPYGTVYVDPSGEMNAPAAQRMARLYAEHGYWPAELQAVGAPDHLGLGLGFLAHTAARGQEEAFGQACAELLVWAPLACLAVEREPAAHVFYRALAAHTAEALLRDAGRLTGRPMQWPSPDVLELVTAVEAANADEDGVRLRELVNFFLRPAHCGVFFSRGRLGRLARELGLALAFGTRFDVAELLFAAAGQAGRLDVLLSELGAEAEAWAHRYRHWSTAYPAWAPVAEHWLGCTAGTLRLIAAMRSQAAAEFHNASAEHG